MKNSISGNTIAAVIGVALLAVIILLYFLL